MDHYDGPAFRRDGEHQPQAAEAAGYKLPPQKHAEKQAAAPVKTVQAKKEPVYHSVDPMAQFVTPPSTVNRKKKPRVNYAAIVADFARSDEDVVLITDDAGGDAVDLQQVQAAAPVTVVPQAKTIKPAAEAKADAAAPQVVVTSDSAAAPAADASGNAAAAEQPAIAPQQEESWPVKLVRPAPPLPQDGSPVQHRMAVSALTPRVAPAPTWLAINIAVHNYFSAHPERVKQ